MEKTQFSPTLDLPTTASHSLELNTGFLAPNRDGWPRTPSSASDWWCLMFPDQVRVYGCPFLEQRQADGTGLVTKSPLSANLDCLAASLGGDERLGHRVIFYEPEQQFYYFDPRDQMFHATTGPKLMNLLRGLLVRCAEAVRGDGAKFQLFHALRSDQVTKAVLNRCKSILAASPEFFSVNSPHQRVQGPEIHQRIAQVFVEQIERDPGQILTLKCAYQLFSQFLKQKNMPVLTRPEVKVMLGELIREQYGLGLRNDLISQESQVQQCGWKGLKLGEVLS
jgi:hypothetical protein